MRKMLLVLTAVFLLALFTNAYAKGNGNGGGGGGGGGGGNGSGHYGDGSGSGSGLKDGNGNKYGIDNSNKKQLDQQLMTMDKTQAREKIQEQIRQRYQEHKITGVDSMESASGTSYRVMTQDGQGNMYSFNVNSLGNVSGPFVIQ